MVLAWIWLGLVGSGWLLPALGNFGWFWLALAGSGVIHRLVRPSRDTGEEPQETQDKVDFAQASYCQAAREIFKTQLEEVREEVNKTGMCEVRSLCYGTFSEIRTLPFL